VTFDSLSEDQQQFVGFICEQASMPDGGLADMWILMVLSGELGVTALEDAWNEIGGGADIAELLAAAAPICEEIGWTP
jgi:hypothetical protein